MQNKYLKFLLIAVIIVVAMLAIGGGVYYIYHNYKTTPLSPIVGNNRDAHGCIGSAGYTWCEVKNKCLRAWEEKCEATACTQEAKICPDGSAVGRTGPKCEFAPCPTPSPNSQAAVINNVNPALVRVGSSIIIKGSKFSDNRNVVSLTPNDTSLLPAYDINAYKIISISNGTEINIAITPENFAYGECRSSGGMCQGKLGKIPDGVYYLGVLNDVCTGYDCESNKISLTIVNQ